MKAKESIIAWNQNSDQVEVGPWPDRTGWSKSYAMTGGAGCANVQDMSHDQLKAYLFIEAMHMIIRDKVDPFAVHRALLKLDVYRDGLAEDMPQSEV